MFRRFRQRSILRSGLQRSNLVLRKPYIVCKFITENAGCVEKSKNSFPVFKIWIQLVNSALGKVMVFSPVWSSLIFCEQYVLDVLVVFFNTECSWQKGNLKIKEN